MLDGCCVGILPVLGVNLTYGCDCKGVAVLPMLAVKSLPIHVKDGTLHIPLTAFVVSGKEDLACKINSAGSSDGHPYYEVDAEGG